VAERRLLGIDLGVTSHHVVAVLNGDGHVLVRHRCRPTADSLASIETTALAGTAPGTLLEVIVEPTGPAWLPVAIFFGRRGHAVFRVPAAKAADLRRFLSRHAKTNNLDAETLARLPLVDPAGLHPLELPGTVRASLDRRVRACDHLTELASSQKVRIRDLARQLYPTLNDAVPSELTLTDLAVLERYGDPRAMLTAGRERLTELLITVSRRRMGADRADAWLRVARAAVELFDDDPAMPFADLADELASEIRLLRAVLAERRTHAKALEAAYRHVDPDGLARTLPGIATIGGPVLVAGMGRPQRFANGAAFKAFTGLTPRASETGETDRKGQSISKAGSARLRDQLVCSAQVARRIDPQLAKVYHRQMTQHGAHHTKAVCVVAARLAERAWKVLARGEPYALCDLDGTPVTPEQARRIIADRYAITEEVRRRRRSRKASSRAALPRSPAAHKGYPGG
jgi:transposase